MGTPDTAGRRERNKQDKLERIVSAAASLFSERPASDVTTQEIADRAGVGAGTLFLYAKSKSELLLLVQNGAYRDALSSGIAAAAEHDPAQPGAALEAVMALMQPIVECNRKQIDNGRAYLRAMLFGDAADPRRGEALAIVAETEAAVAGLLEQHLGIESERAELLARSISAVSFVAMAADPASGADGILAAIKTQAAAILPPAE